MSQEFLTSGQAAAGLGLCKNTVLKQCRQHPGFGFRFGGVWRIPVSHVEAVKRGEPVEAIAARARAGGAAQAA